MRVKKRELAILLFSIVLIFFISSTVSAGFFSDFLNKITGEATQNVNVNISVRAGTAPVIVNVSALPDKTNNQGPAKTDFIINFTVLDSDGAANINTTITGAVPAPTEILTFTFCVASPVILFRKSEKNPADTVELMKKINTIENNKIANSLFFTLINSILYCIY